MLDIGFDIISDLNLEPNDNFNWEDKATSLYCILSGNISSDVQTMVNVLSHLSRFYQGVFYTPGLLEYDSSPLQNINQRTSDIQNIAKKRKTDLQVVSNPSEGNNSQFYPKRITISV